jgi:hypothetical protein
MRAQPFKGRPLLLIALLLLVPLRNPFLHYNVGSGCCGRKGGGHARPPLFGGGGASTAAGLLAPPGIVPLQLDITMQYKA